MPVPLVTSSLLASRNIVPKVAVITVTPGLVIDVSDMYI